jgi:hypothetical protein
VHFSQQAEFLTPRAPTVQRGVIWTESRSTPYFLRRPELWATWLPGLSSLLQQAQQAQPFSRAIFVFRSPPALAVSAQPHTQTKVLVWRWAPTLDPTLDPTFPLGPPPQCLSP